MLLCAMSSIKYFFVRKDNNQSNVDAPVSHSVHLLKQTNGHILEIIIKEYRPKRSLDCCDMSQELKLPISNLSEEREDTNRAVST